jgi:phage shock protein A
MALLERVATLLRANVNDLIEKAEDPEKLAKQLVLDMENQLLQLKTQVAIAIADKHLLQKKQQEHSDAAAEWRRKAELAVEKGKDDLARAALDRSLSHDRLAAGFAQQLEDQTAEAETLRAAFSRLQQKLAETRTATELLIAERRRVKTVSRASAAANAIGAESRPTNVLGRLQASIAQDEATNVARRVMEGEGVRGAFGSTLGTTLEDRFHALEREDRVERLLEEMKGRQPRLEGSRV